MQDGKMMGGSLWTMAPQFMNPIVGRVAVIPLLLISLLGMGRADAMTFEMGQAFPLLRLPSLEDGSPLSVADFRGQKLILHIWASW
jgi:hypothetical protein